jgi:hypothetical protein
MRNLGTEPKIKYYTEVAGETGQLRPELEIRLKTFVDAAMIEMLQPEQNGLLRA